MIQQRELTGLVRRLESHRGKPESFSETIGKQMVQISLPVEEAYSPGRLARLHNNLYGAGVHPPFPLVDKFIKNPRFKGAAVFLAHFELNLQPSPLRLPDNLVRSQRHVREALSTLNSGYAEISAKIQVGR